MDTASTGTERPSFNRFLTARGPSVLRLAYLLSGSPEEAVRLSTDVLSSAGSRWRTLLRDDADPLVVVRIALARANLRSPPQPFEEVESDDELEQRWSEIRAMPARERVLLVLRDWEDADSEELQEVFGRRWPVVSPADSLVLSALRHAEHGAPVLSPAMISTITGLATAGAKRHRHRTWTAGAAVAAAAIVTVVAAQASGPSIPPPPQVMEWHKAWPDSQPMRFRAELSDGRAYWPQSVIDGRTVVGVASIGPADGTPRELVLVDTESGRFTRLANFGQRISRLAVTADDSMLVWALRQQDEDVVRIWRSDRDGSNITLIGDIPSGGNYSGSYGASFLQPIMVRLAMGNVHLVIATGAIGVETYTVPLSGGRPRAQEELSNQVPLVWPWYSTVGLPANPKVTTRNLFTGEVRSGRVPDGQVGVCGPQWCISEPASQVRSDEPTMSSVNRLDGSDQRSLALVDETWLPSLQADRFLLAMDSATSRVSVADLAKRRLVRLPGQVRIARLGDWLLWWDDSRERNLWFAVRMTDLAR